jgi:hypothetical protein
MELAPYERRVRRLALLARPFTEIEDVIDSAPLADDQKAALWLLAWSHQRTRIQRRIARQALAAVANPPAPSPAAGPRPRSE